jgi:hypothetical protein
MRDDPPVTLAPRRDDPFMLSMAVGVMIHSSGVMNRSASS